MRRTLKHVVAKENLHQMLADRRSTSINNYLSNSNQNFNLTEVSLFTPLCHHIKSTLLAIRKPL